MATLAPINVLREAIRQVPSVKYAFGVAGVAAAAALVIAAVGDRANAVPILGGTFLGMVLLYIFSKLVGSSDPGTRVPGLILLYVVIVTFSCFCFFTVTAYGFDWPRGWVCTIRPGSCGTLMPNPSDELVNVVPDAQGTIRFDSARPDLPPIPLVIANEIVVDGLMLAAPTGTLLVANKIRFLNGGGIRGTDFSLVATVVEGGRLDISGTPGNAGSIQEGREPTSGSSGGRIFFASARVDGTSISVRGGHGGKGGDGPDGRPIPRAAGGRKGNCDGFGAYEGARPGSDGRDGNPGMPGQNGGAGGPGGSVTLLLANNTSAPVVQLAGGDRGERGVGGQGGPGQQGGPGGSGCTGLGGSQPNERDGKSGERGPKGSDGDPGSAGLDGSLHHRRVAFRRVAEVWKANLSQPLNALAALQELRP